VATPVRKCNGKENGRPCAEPAVVAIVFKDRSIRPRYWCHAHAAYVREVMARAMQKGSWSEVALEKG